ncbi:hypothetical protein [Pseudodonghicola flavimaris]|uniref:Uncharacterized protein n=1 Tax=Pseudodonghicola flavimaris TaxID=3050036 RepID=A0ABT7F0J6_9RHOB|nr:hypothetical protein [Pseudodonghicola flavimaris]MDK3018105.1 hypothetical protein [Pseudodonghicola flavimaris]
MDVILHIGAHLCATTSFQDYLWCNAERLQRQGTEVWGPRRTRHALFFGLLPGAGAPPNAAAVRRAVGRIRMNLTHCAEAGGTRLIVSDPAMMGSVRANLRMADLYCGLGERLSRLAQAFEGYHVTLALNIRALDAYWAAALAQSITRGAALPAPTALKRLAANPRGWRDVIEEVACAMPEAELLILPFETFGGRPEAQLQALTELEPPRTHARGWLNATPRLAELRAWLPPEQAAELPGGNDRWRPFAEAEAAQLREIYADDLMWIHGGAGGLARLADDPDKKRAVGLTPSSLVATRGRRDDEEDRRLAGAG